MRRKAWKAPANPYESGTFRKWADQVGPVRAVHDFGAGDTLEIARAEGPPLMVPFTRAVVQNIDITAGRLVIDPPPGLLDEPARARRKREKATA